MHLRAFCTFLLILAGALGPVPARAAEPEAPAPPPPYALGLAVRGGASLGSFEAGALYYATSFLAQNPHLGELRIVTGTSAGSINGVLTVLAACAEPEHTPSASPFFTVWTPVGIDGLFDPKRASPTAALTREAGLSRLGNAVQASWKTGLRASCDVVLGIPVTRVEPARGHVDREGTLTLSRSVERFSVRIRGRGPGKPPSITNYADGTASGERAVLVTDEKGEVSFEALLDVVFASSGIPLAFSAVKIPHCLVGGPDHKQKEVPVLCPKERAAVADFVDGGFLDNQPLRLAARTAVSGLTAGPGIPHVHDVPNLNQREVPDNVRLLAIDPAEMTWIDAPVEKNEESSMMEVLRTFVPSLVMSAYQMELQALVEEMPNVSERIRALQSDFPTASAPFANFFGFFEKDFRVFDFYLGMHEARRRLEAWVEEAPAPARLKATYPEDVLAEGDEAAQAWVPYSCLRTALTRQNPPAACSGPRYTNFRALVQTTFDRLYTQCRALPKATLRKLGEGDSPARRHCLAAARGELPPHLIDDRSDQTGAERREKRDQTDAQWLRRADELPHAYFIRRLVAHGFVFHDLGLPPGASAHRVEQRIAEIVGTVASSLAGAQPDHRLLWRSLARVGAQSLAYRAPENAFHVAAGGSWELGWSSGLFTSTRASWLRPSAVVTIDGVSSLLNRSEASYVAFNPALGLELEPTWLSSERLQIRTGFYGGFQFASGDDFHPHHAAAGVATPTSRPAISGHVAGVLYQWVRVQAGAAWFPPFQGERGTFIVRPMLGVEIDTPL